MLFPGIFILACYYGPLLCFCMESKVGIASVFDEAGFRERFMSSRATFLEEKRCEEGEDLIMSQQKLLPLLWLIGKWKTVVPGVFKGKCTYELGERGNYINLSFKYEILVDESLISGHEYIGWAKEKGCVHIWCDNPNGQAMGELVPNVGGFVIHDEMSTGESAETHYLCQTDQCHLWRQGVKELTFTLQ
jgi:hypothetical protein